MKYWRSLVGRIRSVKKRAEKVFHNILLVRAFIKKMRVNFLRVILPLFISFISALMDAVSVALLLPLAKGVVDGDFGFITKTPVIKDVFGMFPASLVEDDYKVFTLLVVMIFSAAVIKHVLDYFAKICVAAEVEKFSSNLKQEIMSRYLSFGKLYFDRTSLGHIQQVLLGVTEQVAGQLMIFQRTALSLFTLAFYLAIMASISWKITVLVLLIVPVTRFLIKNIISSLKRTSYESVTIRKALGKKVQDIFSCMPLVKAYCTEKDENVVFSGLCEDFRKNALHMTRKNNLINPIQQLSMLFVTLLVISFMAYQVVMGGKTEVSTLLVYFYVFKRSGAYFSIFNDINRNLAQVSGPLNELKRVFSPEDKFYVPEGKHKLEKFAAKIELKDLHFSYIRDLPVIKRVSMVFQKGHVTALVGETGSGKTTIANLLMRFYDCPPGTIFIDGRDIRDFKIDSLRSNMSIVGQDTLLFNDTLHRNITYGIDHAREKDVISVIKRARLIDFVVSLPQGIETQVGDRGVMLSGGEKQRVAIARALLKNSDIIILDEATSSLDSVTEKLVQEAIDEAVKDRTAIVIAHRLSTIKHADKIIVLHRGRVVEQGNFRELIETKGKFHEYWQHQKFD